MKQKCGIAWRSMIFVDSRVVRDKHLQESDKRIEEVFRRLDEGHAKPKQGVFYNAQIYDAYTFVSDFIKSAKKRIILIDNYVDETVLTLLDKRDNNVSAIIYTQQISLLALDGTLRDGTHLVAAQIDGCDWRTSSKQL